jgi:hypothetical protein
MFCLSRLGLLSKRRGLWADKWANRFWLMKSVNQFYKLEISRAKSGTDLVDFERRNRWTYRKLACDIIFASEYCRSGPHLSVRSSQTDVST